MHDRHRGFGTKFLIALLPIASSLLLPIISKAQTPESCETRIGLRVSALQATQGKLLRIALRSSTALVDVKGEWEGRAVSFWQDDTEGKVHRAFVGIDLELPPGAHELKVVGHFANGEQVRCSTSVKVRAGRFAVEKLTVAPQFVEPSAGEQARAAKEGERMRAILAGRSAERMWKGAFRFPIDGPRTGGNFGRRRVLNGQSRSPHAGLDIPALTGTRVHATQRGRVALAEELFYAGNTVVVDHGLGVYTFYGHLSAIDVKEGDVVEAGTNLGRVGATGRVTGPHLHWGLTVNEARVNPLQILPQGSAGK
jgi:murein DD-endopeptidase MepM/ murein hydrolase activator NlpD